MVIQMMFKEMSRAMEKLSYLYLTIYSIIFLLTPPFSPCLIALQTNRHDMMQKS